MPGGQEAVYIDGSGYVRCPACGDPVFDDAPAALEGGIVYHEDCVDPGGNHSLAEF